MNRPEEDSLTLDQIAKLGSGTTTEKSEEVAERDHPFVLSVIQEDGSVKEGSCIYHVPGPTKRIAIGRTRVQLAGVPWASLDSDTQLYIDAQAVLAHCLVEKPDWLDKMINERDDVLMRVYQEVREHEARFLARFSGTGEQGSGPTMVRCTAIAGGAMPPDDLRLELRVPGTGSRPDRPAGVVPPRPTR